MKNTVLKNILKDINVNLCLADGGIAPGELSTEIKGNSCIAGVFSERTQIIHPAKGIEFKFENFEMTEFIGFTASVFWTFPINSFFNNVRMYDRYDEPILLHWILWKNKDIYGAIIPIPFRNMIGRISMSPPSRNLDIAPETISVKNEKSSISVRMYSGMPEEIVNEYCKCFVLTLGESPYEAIKDCFREFKAIMKIKEKRAPAFADYIGWCSWNSFYKDVSEENILKILEEFKANKFPVKWILIDDGWELEKDQQLSSLEADKKKFPSGLASFIKKVKSEYKIKYLGIWLPVTGHWRGLNIKLKKNFNIIKTNRGYFLSPEKSFEFFDAIFSYLKGEGVDFVKIDNLNGLTEHFGFNVPLGKVYNTILGACGKLVSKYFGNNKIVASMNQAFEVVGNLKNCAIFRNSDDYYPEDQYIKRTSSHIIQNSFNLLWTREFGLPDCDMFFSCHSTGELHPILRAISGGPVYFTDKPKEHDFRILRKFVDSCGKLLKPDDIGLPTEDSLFRNHDGCDHVIKIFNVSGNAGIIAAFNPNQKRKIDYTINSGDIKNIKGTKFVIWAHIKKTSYIIPKNQNIKTALNGYSSELFTVAPVIDGIGVVGAVDKYISPAAVKDVQKKGKSLSIKAIAGKKFILYSEKVIEKVFINGEEKTFKANGKIIEINIKEEI